MTKSTLLVAYVYEVVSRGIIREKGSQQNLPIIDKMVEQTDSFDFSILFEFVVFSCQRKRRRQNIIFLNTRHLVNHLVTPLRASHVGDMGISLVVRTYRNG